MKRHDYWFSEWRLISFLFKLLMLIKHTAGITIDTADKHWKISWESWNIICMICKISIISNIFMPPILQNIYLFWNSWNQNKFSFICRWQNFFLDQQACSQTTCRRNHSYYSFIEHCFCLLYLYSYIIIFYDFQIFKEMLKNY